MTCNVLASGSKGNAVIIGGGTLIDCGVPFKLLEPYVSRLRLVLLTHIHGDHFNPATLRRLHMERPALRFGCCEWLVKPLVDAGIPPRCIDVYMPDYGYSYVDLTVSPFTLTHDVENCGYRLEACNGKKIIYATDTATLEGISARDYDLYLVEANYTEAEMEERIKRKIESGEFIYEYRAAAGHLSQEQTEAWLAQNATPGKSKVIYLHKHHDE